MLETLMVFTACFFGGLIIGATGYLFYYFFFGNGK